MRGFTAPLNRFNSGTPRSFTRKFYVDCCDKGNKVALRFITVNLYMFPSQC